MSLEVNNMRLTDLVGFGLTVIIYDEDGTHVVETTEQLEQQIERRKNKEANNGQ
jgi:hypothetical protein